MHLDKVGPVLEERKDTCKLDDFSQVYDAFDAIFKVNMQAMALTVRLGPGTCQDELTGL